MLTYHNTKNSDVASEGDQTLCNYKGVFLKKSPAILPLFFLIVFLAILRINCLNCKVTIFSYIMYKSIVCFLASYSQQASAKLATKFEEDLNRR